MWRQRIFTILLFTLAAYLLQFYLWRLIIAGIVVGLATDEYQYAALAERRQSARILHVAGAEVMLLCGMWGGLMTMNGWLFSLFLILVCVELYAVQSLSTSQISTSSSPSSFATGVGLNLKDRFHQLVISFFGHVYIGYFFSHVGMYGGGVEYGIIGVNFVLICTGVGETAGLLFGRFVGGLSQSHSSSSTSSSSSLSEPTLSHSSSVGGIVLAWLSCHPVSSISPNKSLAGFLAQVWGTVVCGILFYQFTSISHHVSFGQAVGWSLVLSVGGIVGDLFESAIKRAHHLKDMSDLLPGVGGMLDRFDGALFNFPLTFYYLWWVAPRSLQTLSPFTNPS